ncbi:hypothetical protein WN51_11355, partial [Melipona quadrifasciata]
NTAVVFLGNVVADPGSPSRYCSQTENEYENKIGNDACIIHKYCHYPVTEQYPYEPRLEIVRSDIIAERLVTKLIDYCPYPSVMSIDEQMNYTEDALKEISNSVNFRNKKSQEELNEKRKPKVRRSLKLKNNENSLNFTSSSEETKKRNEKTNLISVDANSMERITEIVNYIDSSIPSIKTKLNTLFQPKVKISKKYSLDPNDMNLIYSLTPFMNSDDHESVDKMILNETSKLTTFVPESNDNLNQNCFLQSNEEKSLQNGWNKKDCVDEKIDNYIWFDSLFDSEKYDPCKDNKTMNNDICFDNGQVEIHSNEGSDMLELSTNAVLELLESTEEYFRNDLSNMANEIIAELNMNDTYIAVYCLVNEIFQKVCDIVSNIELNDPRDSLSSTIFRHYSISKPCLVVKDDDQITKEYQTDQTTPVVVVHEVIHHVYDACDEIKKAKTCANVELKEKENNDINNEREEIEQQIDDFPIMINSNELETASDLQVSSTVTSFENLVLEKNNQFVETVTEVDDTTESDAIFEFRTIVKTKPTNTDEKAYELNFRIERNFGANNIENKKLHDREKVEFEPTVSLDNLININWNTNSYNSLEIASKETELIKLPETSTSVEIPVDGTHCVNSYIYDYDQGCSSLSTIGEEESWHKFLEENDINDNAEVEENRLNN